MRVVYPDWNLPEVLILEEAIPLIYPPLKTWAWVATNVARGGKRENIFVRNNVSSFATDLRIKETTNPASRNVIFF